MKSILVFMVSLSSVVNLVQVFASNEVEFQKYDHHSNGGESDKVSGQLKLSSWELHVLNDLYMEISLLQCPSTIVKSTVRGLKRFISKQISTAPLEQTQNRNSQFYSVYRDLVRCLENLQENTHIHHYNGKSKDAVIVDHQSAWENKKFGKEKLFPKRMTQKAYLNKNSKTIDNQNKIDTTKQQLEDTSSSFLLNTWKWILEMFKGENLSSESKREKRGIRYEFVQTEAVKFKKQIQLAHQDFSVFLDMLSQIVLNSCPTSNLRLTKSFTTQAVKDIVRVLAQDVPSMVSAIEYYFVRSRLWEQVTRCTIAKVKKPLRNQHQYQ